MFCTTECWNCEDKTCEHYISKQDLYFDNIQLKERIEKAIGHINVCGCELSTDEVRYLFQILKGEEK